LLDITRDLLDIVDIGCVIEGQGGDGQKLTGEHRWKLSVSGMMSRILRR